MSKKDKRTRKQHRFWLDEEKESEFLISKKLSEKKQGREYQGTIRNSLSLFMSLMDGDIEMLKIMFPWVYEEIAKQIFTDRLDNIAAMIASQNGSVKKSSSMSANIEIKKSNIDSGRNFMTSLNALRG